MKTTFLISMLLFLMHKGHSCTIIPGSFCESLQWNANNLEEVGECVGETRIGNQIEIIFNWKEGNASNVKIVDYH